MTLPLEQIGQLVSLEDSLYKAENDTYIQPKPVAVTKPRTNNTTTKPKPTVTGSYDYHKVRSGETLGVIASRYGMSVRELQRVNGLNSTRIYVGPHREAKYCDR